MNEQFPQWWAYVITVTVFLLLMVGSWLIPGKEIIADAPDQARWRDLRMWATVLVGLQLLIYYLFS